jgi:hypothetical protein
LQESAARPRAVPFRTTLDNKGASTAVHATADDLPFASTWKNADDHRQCRALSALSIQRRRDKADADERRLGLATAYAVTVMSLQTAADDSPRIVAGGRRARIGSLNPAKPVERTARYSELCAECSCRPSRLAKREVSLSRVGTELRFTRGAGHRERFRQSYSARVQPHWPRQQAPQPTFATPPLPGVQNTLPKAPDTDRPSAESRSRYQPPPLMPSPQQAPIS